MESDRNNELGHQTISFCTVDGADQAASITQGRRWKTKYGVNLDTLTTGLLLARWTKPTAANYLDMTAAAEDSEAAVTAAADFACPPKVRHRRLVFCT